jgi:hypothetical protein
VERMQQKSRQTQTVTVSVTPDEVRRKINLLIQHPGRLYYVSKANYVKKLKDMTLAEINFCN